MHTFLPHFQSIIVLYTTSAVDVSTYAGMQPQHAHITFILLVYIVLVFSLPLCIYDCVCSFPRLLLPCVKICV